MARQRILHVAEARYRQLKAILPLVQYILDEKVTKEDIANLVLQLGFERILTDIFGGAEREALVKAQLQMAEENPEFVYSYTLDRLRQGTELTKEELPSERPMGFLAGWQRQREEREKES
ncbi:MAG: hypothetical protein HYU86_08520 [Chloroflexi bacterium]|nr:hypothetical protein [Chloroflexota bacterium]